jgi:Uma2 family endonuclease
MATTEHVWTCDDLDRVCDAGLLGNTDRVELIDGELIYKLDYCPEAAAFYQEMGVPLRRHWTRAEDRELVRLGILQPGEIVQLAEGDAPPARSQKPRHPTTVLLCGDTLRHFLKDCCIREEKPLRLDVGSEPEPDLVVVPGTPRDYVRQHPMIAWLLIEVADSSLGFDRKEKASLYARAGIQDYWIVNLVDHQLEVRRQPVPMTAKVYGHDYQSVVVIPSTGTVSPLVRSDLHMPVAELLP